MLSLNNGCGVQLPNRRIHEARLRKNVE